MIKLNEQYYLASEPLNYTLKELKIGKNGKETYKTVGYYYSIDSLLRKLLENTYDTIKYI